MGDVLDRLSEKHIAWAMDQKVFFVSTAPLQPSGHLNCSPKGGDCFKFLDPETFVYADYTGSGNETIAHVKENGRILILFCAFKGPPRIMRLHGQGEVVLPDHSEFKTFREQFPENIGLRAFIKVSVQRASVSCGYSVPFYEFVGHRDTLDKWATATGKEGLKNYRAKKNRTSIDGLPGYEQLRGEMD